MQTLKNFSSLKTTAIVAFLLGGIVLTVAMQTKFNNGLATDKADEYLTARLELEPSQTSVDPVRTERNSRFDNWNWVRKSVREGVTVGTMQNDWEVGLPALPAEKSSAIVIGIVRSGKAFLSNDQTGVYAEFLIDVVDWMKADGVIHPEPKSLTVKRPGGKVIYPSGQTVTYLLAGQEMPKLDGKYVFFLAKKNGDDVHSILTAYDITDGRSQPLDGSGKYKAAGLKFKKFEGLSEHALRDNIFAEMGRTTVTKPQ